MNRKIADQLIERSSEVEMLIEFDQATFEKLDMPNSTTIHSLMGSVIYQASGKKFSQAKFQ